MTGNQHPVVLLKEALESGPAEVVDGNVDVVNEMYQELLGQDEIAPDALRSYYVDYYLNQVLAGGFAQYVFGVEDRESVDELVSEGLEALGAHQHAAHFARTVELFGALSEHDAEAYLDGESEEGEVSASVTELEDLDEKFDEILEEEDLLSLNAAFLRNHEGLVVVDEDGLEAIIDARLETVTDLDERREAALTDDEDDEYAGLSESEIIIRELCDVAEVELDEITRVEEDFDYDGEQVDAWHFTAEGQEYLMVELEDEAHMVRPDTLEVVAIVEIEDLDDDEDYEDDVDEDEVAHLEAQQDSVNH